MREKKKILFVFTLPPPTHGSNIVNQYISRFNYDDFVNSEIFPLRYANSIAGIGSYDVLKLILFLKYIYRLNKKIRNYMPDFVYFVPAVTGISFIRDCIYILLFKFYNIKVILHLHGKGINNKTRFFINKSIYKWFFKKTKIIHLSRELIYDLKGVFDISKIYILPNGVEPHSGDNISQKNDNNKKNDVTLLFLSNFIESKGVFDFLKSCKRLKEQGYNFKISLIGNFTKNISNELLNTLLSNYNLNKDIIHLGPAYGSEKMKLICNSDIFIFPTFYEKECFPLVILEAMSMKLPVIATNEGAISEIIENDITGFIVEKRDINNLSIKIAKLINDYKLRNLMAENAYKKFLDNYTLKTFEKKFKNLIFNIIYS